MAEQQDGTQGLQKIRPEGALNFLIRRDHQFCSADAEATGCALVQVPLCIGELNASCSFLCVLVRFPSGRLKSVFSNGQSYKLDFLNGPSERISPEVGKALCCLAHVDPHSRSLFLCFASCQVCPLTSPAAGWHSFQELSPILLGRWGWKVFTGGGAAIEFIAWVWANRL